MLLETWLEIAADWREVFRQRRTARRAVRQALGSLVCLGRRTLSRVIWTNGGEQRSWSAEYFLHSRAQWDPQQLFAPLLRRALPWCEGRLVGVAVDDTRLRKTGMCIAQAFYQRDLKRFNLSRRFTQMMSSLRRMLDAAGAPGKLLVLAADGSFCNRTVFSAPRDRTEIVARARQDAVLCLRAPQPSRRFYAPQKFSPEQVRQQEAIPWRTTKLFYGGKRRRIRYKQLPQVYWQGGARRQPLRLFVVAPTPYRKRKNGRLYYRRPAYLLTTDLSSGPRPLLQIYFDRWQIEVNHREEKDTLGVGQAQLWNPTAVPKQPALAVAAYSALLLASLIAGGPQRGPAYAALPKWRRHAKRPSCLDLITLLRQQMAQNPHLLAPLGLQPSFRAFTAAAAA